MCLLFFAAPKTGLPVPSCLIRQCFAGEKTPLKQSHEQRGSAVLLWNEVVTPQGSPGAKGLGGLPRNSPSPRLGKFINGRMLFRSKYSPENKPRKNRFIPRVTYPASDIPLPCSVAENVGQKWEKRAKNEWQFTKL